MKRRISQLRAHRINSSLCPTCGVPVPNMGSYCIPHFADREQTKVRMKLYANKTAHNRNLQYHERALAGLCIQCRKPNDRLPRRTCAECAAKYKVWQQGRPEAVKQRAAKARHQAAQLKAGKTTKHVVQDMNEKAVAHRNRMREYMHRYYAANPEKYAEQLARVRLASKLKTERNRAARILKSQSIVDRASVSTPSARSVEVAGSEGAD
jgi:hypothetical protein